MANRFFWPFIGIEPLAGDKLEFYIAGTSTPKDTYTDSALAVPSTNPVVADGDGVFADIYLAATGDYKVILKTSAGVTRDTADDYAAFAGATAATQAEVDARLLTNAFIPPAYVAGGLGLQGSSIGSAAALTLPTVGDYFAVTGTTTITSISARTAGREVVTRFDGVLTLTHNATTLILLGGANIVTAAGDVARWRSEGSGNWRLVGYSRASGFTSGSVAQIVSAQSGAVATGTTALPYDDTIPQNTEGDEYLTLAITPKSASSTLIIEAVVFCAHSAATDISLALFQDATAGALAAVAANNGATNVETVIVLRHKMTAGTTSATTFKIRGGGNTGSTFTFNGSGGARKFGGVAASSLTITEIAP